MDEKSVGIVSIQCSMPWEVYVDGAINQRGSGVGLVLVSPEKITIEKSLRLGFSAMNNEAKCETQLIGMMMVQKMGGKMVKVYSDSRLVVGQVRGELEAQDPRMQEYLSQVRNMQTKFEVFDVSYVPRGGNTHADSLATLATFSTQDLPRVILVEDLCTPTPLKRDLPQIHQIRLGPSWWILYCCSLKEIYCVKRNPKLKKYEGKLLVFGCMRIENCINVLFLVLICFVYTPRHQNHSWKSCMKGFVGVTPEENLYLIGILLKDSGGQTCKRRHKNMSGNVISVKDSHRTFTSLEEFSILFPTFGHLLNRAWILWNLSLKQ